MSDVFSDQWFESTKTVNRINPYGSYAYTLTFLRPNPRSQGKRSNVRKGHVTSRIPKNASGKREHEMASLSGELLIGDDFLVARLGLGTMRLTGKGIWGEPSDRSEAIRVVRRAVEFGVNFIDTADSYGPHVSERIIAEALYPSPEGVVVATKGGFERPGPDQIHPARPVALGRHPHAGACGGVRRRVSNQGGRRSSRGDRGERGAHGAERHRLRESSPGARTR
jgi:Aldo/keto reductase family